MALLPLSFFVLQKLAVSLVLSELDYGNATLTEIAICLYQHRRLQSVENAAANDSIGQTGALIKYVYNQKPFYPTGVTGFVDVRDVVSCMISLMQSEISAERFIISSENIAYKTLMDWAAAAMQRKKSTIKVTPILNFIGWRFEKILSLITGRSPLITKETTASSVKKQYYLNDKISAATGHHFIPIKESVAWTCKIFLEGQEVES